MNPDKEIIVSALLEKLNASPFVILVDYTGTTVAQFSEIRGKLAETNANLHISKNRYIRLASQEAKLPDELAEHLKGQTAMVVGDSDICAAAKVLKTAQKEHKHPVMKAGVLDGEVVGEDQLNALAALPPKPVLQAQLLGVLQAPASKLVRTLNEPGAALARVLAAKKD